MDLAKIMSSAGGFMKDRGNEPSTFAGMSGLMGSAAMSNPYMMYGMIAVSLLSMLMKEKKK